uniref:NFACT RNA-binding domain-containing protein n=1 Tax=Paramoeba aestuarina TaxID=180227 RepID=A0A7S4PLF7_9EUKA|mmetsp:Transcript_8582/g.13014  ORF Transcript_8582/g.13014 Transcript_8582/m.13014 type:complete len:205 (+) Transcript_8582:1400-2014(+)
MVYIYKLSSAPHWRCYVGEDKYENEELLKVGWEEDIWFHVDTVSSCHCYLRLPSDVSWENIPATVLTEVGQLVKLNSITGNKLPHVNVIYSPFSNLRKEKGSDIGAVSFFDRKSVKKFLVEGRRRDLTNVTMKTRIEVPLETLQRETDQNNALRRQQAKEHAEEAARKEKLQKQDEIRLKHERSYASLMQSITPVSSVDEDDFM